MADIREYAGRKFEVVSVHDVGKRDLIKVEGRDGSRLVEIVDISFHRDPDTGHIGNWTIMGDNNREYTGFDVNLYLKPL